MTTGASVKPHRPPLPAFKRLLEHRREKISEVLKLQDPQELDAALSDLDYFLTVTWTFVRDVDRNASVPKQRHELKRLIRTRCFDAEEMHNIDPALANRIGVFLTGGTLRLLYGRTAPMEVEAAARQALRQFPHQTRGRPLNSVSLAFRQFALGLATVWRDHRGTAPTRIYSVYRSREYGPFRDFVELIANTIPASVRAPRGRRIPEVDYLVRAAIEEFHAAAISKDPRRLRGHIDERAWLGTPKARRHKARKADVSSQPGQRTYIQGRRIS